MTTNGFLLNLDCIQKLKQTKIERYQITIDAPEHIHNQTRVVQDGSGSFQTLIANIKNLLSETEAKVTIRNNLSKANMNYAAELMEYLHTEGILDSDRVHVLFQELHNYSDSADYSVFFKDNEYFPAMLKLKRLLMQYGKPVHAYGPLKNSCRIYQNNTFVIGSNLDLECCTTDDKAIGHINEDGVPIWNTNLKEKKRFYAPDTSCDSCILLPMCMGGCPYKRSKEQCSCIMDPEDLLEYIILLRDSTIKFNAK